MSGNRDQFRKICPRLLQELLEAEMTEALSAGKASARRVALATARDIMTAR